LSNIKSNQYTQIDLTKRAEFEQAFDSLFPRIYAYVAFRVGREQDAEDIVSETFARAIEKLGRFERRNEGSLKAWLFTIASNLLKNHYRRNASSKEELSSEESPLIKDTRVEPDQILAKKERFLQLRQIMATLGPRYQEVITLKFFGGLRNQEIAKVLNLKEKTVAAYLVRGLKQLEAKYSALPTNPREDIR